MKKIMIILVVAFISVSASAQRGFKGRVSYPRTHVVVTYARPYYPYYGYDPFFYPYYYPYNTYPRETRLEVRIADIRSDYREKIWSARHDKNLKKSERKATVHQLKRERDKAINDAKINYYKSH